MMNSVSLSKIGVASVIVLALIVIYKLNGTGISYNVTGTIITSATPVSTHVQRNSYSQYSGTTDNKHGNYGNAGKTYSFVGNRTTMKTVTVIIKTVTDIVRYNMTERNNNGASKITTLNISGETGGSDLPSRNRGNIRRAGIEQLYMSLQKEPRSPDPYNIMTMNFFEFDKKFKNPCWKDVMRNISVEDGGKIHCLPYFYIIGVKKSGTTDLYSRLSKHPQICSPGFKESQWLSRLRFGGSAHVLRTEPIQELIQNGPSVKEVDFYVSMYDVAAKCITSNPRAANESDQRFVYHSVTGDGTPAIWHRHSKWEQLPGNEGLDEPRYTSFHYIKHLTPEAKIIVILREPISRIYSDFYHMMKAVKMENPTKVFHDHVITLLEAYRDCFDKQTFRACVFSNSLRSNLCKKGILLAESFHASFYAFYMKELLSVFRRDQVLPVLMLDHKENMSASMRRVFKFLELDPLGDKEMEELLGEDVKNTAKLKNREYSEMRKETKALLTQFFKPYNKEMADLMGDKRYLFNSSVR